MRPPEESLAWRDPVASAFLVLSLVFGTLFVFLTPPFQVPDEPAHFFRAYAISEGSFRLRTYDRIPAQPLPSSLRQFALEVTGNRIGDQRATISVREIRNAIRYRLEPEKKVLMAVPLTPSGPVAFSAGGYIPVAYLPAAAALAIGRWVDAPVLAMFYGARLANLVAATFLCWLAIRTAPIGRRILTGVALLPMASFLRSSLSPDGILIALGLLAFALALEAAFEKRWSQPLTPLLIVSFLLVASKPLYLLLPLLAVVTGGGRKRSAGRMISLFAAGLLTAAAGLAVAGAWVVAPLQPAEGEFHELEVVPPQPELPSVRKLESDSADSGFNIQKQARGVVTDPLRFLSLAASEYWARLPALLYQFVGRFGWLDTPLPLTARLLFLGMLAFLALTDGRSDFSLSAGQRVLLSVIFAGTLLVTATILYVSWTPPGAAYIEGIQGRYFIPVAPAALLLLTSSSLTTAVRKQHLTIVLSIIAALVLTIAAWSIYARFYGQIASPMMYMAELPTGLEPYTDILHELER